MVHIPRGRDSSPGSGQLHIPSQWRTPVPRHPGSRSRRECPRSSWDVIVTEHHGYSGGPGLFPSPWRCPSRTAIGNGNGQLRAGAMMTHTLIYPSNSAHSSEGHLEIDSCDVVELAERFGTPLMVYEEKTIRDQCRRFQEGFSRLTQDFEVIYAGKALCTLAICALVVEEGLSLDVSSGGEYYTALQAGVPTDRIFFHGNNKTQAELEYVLDNGVGCVVVDNLYEMELLDRLAGVRGNIQRVLLRITPGVEAHTHEYIQTGQEDSKFGFGLVEGRAEEAIRRALEAQNLDLAGLHAHIGSQIFELEGFRRAIAVLVDLIRTTHESLGFDCRYLNVGGGLGIRYTEEDTPVTVDEYVECKVSGVRHEMQRVGLPMPRVLVEPGRSLVGKAGVTAYTVGS